MSTPRIPDPVHRASDLEVVEHIQGGRRTVLEGVAVLGSGAPAVAGSVDDHQRALALQRGRDAIPVPMSPGEEAMRGGLCLMALGFLSC
jgi:hypothetical protein